MNNRRRVDRRQDDLPLDSDLEVVQTPGGRPRPVHLRWRYLGLVFVGGFAGTATREYVTLVIPPVGSFPIATFAINILGAFLLGAFLEGLVRRGPDAGVRRALRLLIGTGFLGGFTTYSALATDTALLFGSRDVGTAVIYSLATVVLGAIATWSGIVVAAGMHRRRIGADG